MSIEPTEEDKKAVLDTIQAQPWYKDAKFVVIAIICLLQMFGYSTNDVVQYVRSKVGSHTAPEVAPVAVSAEESPAPEPSTTGITQEQIEEIIKQVLDRVTPLITPPAPAPAPAPQPEPPKPEPEPPKPSPEPVVTDLKVQLTSEQGEQLTTDSVDAGQVIRISAAGAKGKIGWQPVTNGEVHLIASTDGREYFGYLTSGSWLQIGLTDFDAQKQVSMRVKCNQAPQPPPIPPHVDPAPAPPKPVPPPPGNVSLVVVHDSRHASVESSILMNSDVWQKLKKQGNEYLFVEETDNSSEAKKYKSDLDGVSVPALLIYDKKTGKKLSVMPRPKTVEELKVVVYSYTGGED